jgi:hypothetical protein
MGRGTAPAGLFAHPAPAGASLVAAGPQMSNVRTAPAGYTR